MSLSEHATKYQIGIIVKNARRVARILSEKFGFGPFVEEVLPSVSGRVRGKPANFDILVISADLGPVELELLQPLRGRSVLNDFLEKGGGGIHHIGLYVEDFDKELARLKRRGIKVLQWSRLPPKYPKASGYAYMDTESALGFVLEIANPPPLGLSTMRGGPKSGKPRVVP